jgi:hypothetical protein
MGAKSNRWYSGNLGVSYQFDVPEEEVFFYRFDADLRYAYESEKMS